MAKSSQFERITHEEYLRREAESPVKHDFIDGRMVEREIVAMAGGSPNHVEITPTLLRMLGVALRKQPCRPFGSDTLVHVDEIDRDYYPDAGVACPPNYLSETVGVIDNPTVVIEVLSPSSERDDRGDKFRDYRLLPTLQDYVLVSTKRATVEVFSRQADDSWNLRVFLPGTSAHLPSVGVDLPLDEIYENATFDDGA